LHHPAGIFMTPSIPPLPAPLAQAMAAGNSGLPKRERTRRQLLESATRVITARGLAASTIQEIALEAGMTPGTVYNHFATREEILTALAYWIADTLCARIADSQVGIPEGAERMSIGMRRYVWLAEQSPAWAVLMLEVAQAASPLLDQITSYARDDLRLGMKQKSFRVASEEAAIDLVSGAVTNAMHRSARGAAPPGHGSAVAAMVLRGLGMSFDAALEITRRPLPDFPQPGTVPQRPPYRFSEAAMQAAKSVAAAPLSAVARTAAGTKATSAKGGATGKRAATKKSAARRA
jgi:AcrR family transcriptional regulator